MGRLATAWKAFWSILGSDEQARRWREGKVVEADDEPAAKEAPPAAKTPDGDAVYTLVVLQREGRLIDFLQEDIDGYADAQVGAAVRQVHARCRKALQECFDIQPLHEGNEEERVTVSEGYDPRHVRVSGKAAGSPPFEGVLRHRGWRVAKVDFPERHGDLDPNVIQPAEVEV